MLHDEPFLAIRVGTGIAHAVTHPDRKTVHILEDI